MREVYIPKDRLKALSDSKVLGKMAKACNCKMRIVDESVRIEGDAFGEFAGKSVVYAFGRGFDVDVVCKLAGNDCYFTAIDLEQVFGNEKRIAQVKARIIGENGRTKRYVEGVSGARISVYGNTVAFIGSIEDIREAETAVNTLIEGGTHRLAYSKMESEHRKHKEAARGAGF